MDSFLYSPSGSSDMYKATSSFTGSGGSVNLTRLASSVGQAIRGTFSGVTLCKVDSSLNLLDSCATTKGVSSGSFNIFRDWDNAL